MPRPQLLFLALMISITAPAFGQRTASRGSSDRSHAHASETIAALQSNLKNARRMLADIRDQRTREKLEVLLSRAALQADELDELLGRSGHSQHRTPISEAEFAKLIDNVKDQSFDDDKIDFLKTFVKQRPLNCEQAAKILKTLSFDDGRSQAAIILYPSITDSENFYEILKILPFESSRKKVMEAVRKRD